MSKIKISSSNKISKDIENKLLKDYINEIKSGLRKENRYLDISNMDDDIRKLAEDNLRKDMKFITENSDSIIFKQSNQNIVPKVASKYDSNIKTEKNIKLFKMLNEKGFFDVISGKNQSGSKLLKKTINLNDEINVSPAKTRDVLDIQEVKKSLDNMREIYNKGGFIISHDLETIGGTNKLGHAQQDIITEMSATVFKYSPGENHLDSDKVVHDRFDTVVGISKNEHKELTDRLAKIKESGVISDNDKVLVGRLMVYGDEQTELGSFDGWNVGLVNGANSSEMAVGSVDEKIKKAIKGADFLYSDVGIKQAEWIEKNAPGETFESYRTKKIKEFKDYVFEAKGIQGVDKNSRWMLVGQNSKNFDANALKMLTGSSSTWEYGKHFDLLPILRVLEQYDPNSQILRGPDGKEIMLDGRFGKNQLENLARAYNLLDSSKASHIAKEDQEAFFRLILTKQPGQKLSLFDHVEGLFNEFYDSNKTKYSKGIDGKLFLSDGLMANWFDNSENKSLGFSYDNLTGEYKTYNGYSIDNNANVSKAGYEEFGPKSNMLLTHSVDEFDINSKELKEIFSKINEDGTFGDKMFQEFSTAEKVYVVTSQEYLDKEIRKEMLGNADLYDEGKTFYTFTTDKSQISSIVGSVVQDENGKISEDIAKNGLTFDVYDHNGTTRKKTITDPDEIIHHLKKSSVEKRVFDSARRNIRDANSKSLWNAQQHVEKIRTISNTKNFSMGIAEIISKNKTVGGIADSFKNLEILGYHNKKNNKYVVTNDTARKGMALATLYERNENEIKLINNVLDTISGTVNESSPKSVWNKRDYTLGAMFKHLGETYGADKDVIEEYYKEAGLRVNNSKIKDILDIEIKSINPKKYRELMHSNIGKSSKDVVSLDMSNMFNFFKPFQESIYGSRDIMFEGAQGLNIIEETYNVFKNHKKYAKLLEGFDFSEIERYRLEGGSNKQLGGQLLSTIKKNVRNLREDSIEEKSGTVTRNWWKDVTNVRKEVTIKGDKDFGYLYSRNDVDFQSPEFVKSISKVHGIEKLEESLLEVKDNIPKGIFFGEKPSEDAISSLVDNYLFKISDSDFEKQIEGYSDAHKRILRTNFNLAKKDARGYAETILDATYISGATLGIQTDSYGNSSLVSYQNNTSKTLKAYTYGIQDGGVYANIGNDRYSVYAAINSHSMQTSTKYNPASVSITNNFENSRTATERKASTMINSYMKNRGMNGSEAIDEYLNSIIKNVSAKKVRVEKNNFIALDKSMQLDINGLIPLLVDNSDEILSYTKEKYAGDEFFGEKDIDQFTEMIDRLKKSRKNNKEITSLEELLANEKNLFNIKFKEPMKMWLKDKIGDDSSYLLDYSGTLFTKDTVVMRGMEGLGNTFADPTASFDDTKRPPVTQKAKVTLYEKEKIEKEAKRQLSELGETESFREGMFDTDRTLKARLSSSMKERFISNVDGKHTGNVVANQMQISSENLRSFYIKEFEEDGVNKYIETVRELYGDVGAIKERAMAEQLHKKAMLLSTYEQQGHMDARFADTYFNKTNVQTIADKKVMLMNHSNNLAITKAINLKKTTDWVIDTNGKIKYQIGKHVKRNELLFELSKEITDSSGKRYHAAHNGVIEGVFLDSREMKISEKQLQNELAEQFGEGYTREQAAEYLSGKYQWGYRIIGNEELGGIKISSSSSEKATVSTNKMKIGSLDERLLDDIEYIANSIDNENEANIIRDLKGVSEKEYLDKAEAVLNKHGVELGIVDRIRKERYAFSTLTRKFDALKNAGVFIAVDTGKHSSISQGMTEAMESLEDSGLLNKKVASAIFGEENIKVEDGRIMLETPKYMRISRDALEKAGLTGDELDKVSELMDSENIYNKFGKLSDDYDDDMFSMSRVEITQTVDHIESTSRGDDFHYNDLINRKNELIEREKQIDKDLTIEKKNVSKLEYNKRDRTYDFTEDDEALLSSGKDNISALNEQGLAIKNEIADVSDSILSFKKDKGLKYSSRMQGILMKEAYTDDSNKLMRDAFIEGEMQSGVDKDTALQKYINSMKGVVDDSGNLIDDIKGQRILKPLIEDFQSQLFLGDGEETLSNVIERMNILRDKVSSEEKWNSDMKSVNDGRKHINNLKISEEERENLLIRNDRSREELITNKPVKVKQAELDELELWDKVNGKLETFIPEEMHNEFSIERAQMERSFAVNNMAMRFNESANPNYKKYEDFGFKIVDLSTASDDVDFMPTNIKGDAKSALFLGTNLYKDDVIIKTGLKEAGYESIAIGSMPLKYVDGEIQKTDTVSGVEELQRLIKELNVVEDPSDKENLERLAKKQMDKIRESQKKDINSKTGLSGQLSERRMSQSVFARGRGLTVQKIGLNGQDLMDSTIGSFNERLAEFDKVNYALKDLMYEGESINSHFLKGRKLDVIKLSESAFEDMGYFNESFMDSVFEADGSDYKGVFSTVEEKRNQMIKMLETHGDSFLATRFPEIMEGSDKMVLGYLDRGLSANEAIALGHTGGSMKMDHDGDKFGFKRVEAGGKSLLHQVAGIGLDDSESSIINSFHNSLIKRSLIENDYWDRKVEAQLIKEFEFTKGGSSIADLASKETINGTMYAASTFDENLSYNEYQHEYNKYSKVINEAESTFVDVADDYGNVNDYIMHKIATEEGYENLTEKGLAMARGYEKYRAQNASKIFKSAVGEVNVTAFKIKSAFSMLADSSSENYDYASGLIYDMFYWSEEAAISAKKTIKGLDPGRVKIFNEGIMDYINKNTDKRTLSETRNVLSDWMHEYITNEIDMEYHYTKSDHFRNLAKRELGVNNVKEFRGSIKSKADGINNLKNIMVDDFMTIIDKASQTEDFGTLIEALVAETSGKGISNEQYRRGGMIEDLSRSNNALIRKMTADLTNDNLVIENMIKQSINFENHTLNDAFGGLYADMSNNSSKGALLDDIIETGQDMFKSVKGSNIALGALGVAAAVMTAGFVGGRPRPADMHAMEEAQDNMAPAGTGMVLSDMGYAQPSASQGYVVNINARTDKGRDNTVNAIQQAITNATQSNINIAMNVNDEYGNVNDSDIRDAIMGAF